MSFGGFIIRPLWLNHFHHSDLCYCFSFRIKSVIQSSFPFIFVARGGGGGHLNVTWRGGAHFLKSLHNPFRKKNCILIPCFGIFRLENNRKIIGKTIAYCSWTNCHNPFWNFWSIFIPRSGIYKMIPWKTARPVQVYNYMEVPPPGFVGWEFFWDL